MSATVSTDMLEGVIPLRELDEEALEILAGEAEIEEFPPKTVIFRMGSADDWTRYVLSGEVILAEGPGSQRSVLGMGNAGVAEEPLGMEASHSVSAVARTEVRLIRLPTARIEQLLEDHRLPDYDVSAVEEGQGPAGDQLFYQLVQDLLQDRLELPSMPDIAVRVRQAINDPETGAPEVAKILQADPVVAARLMQAANSAMYTGKASVDNLNAAIVRLGLKNVRELVMAVTMREVFKAKNALLKKRMVELWMHSTLVAAISSVLARKLKGFDPDRALLAGLVHDIGVVPMLNNAGEYPELAEDPAGLESTISSYRDQVGGMILRRWNFPEEMVAVALEAENWEREHDGPADYADLIIAAQLQSYAGSPDASRYPDLDGLPVYSRLGLAELGISESEPILDEAREEIAEVQRFLIG